MLGQEVICDIEHEITRQKSYLSKVGWAYA
jgi:hypothetical protein